jgi:hypothetical protein
VVTGEKYQSSTWLLIVEGLGGTVMVDPEGSTERRSESRGHEKKKVIETSKDLFESDRVTFCREFLSSGAGGGEVMRGERRSDQQTIGERP